MPVKKEEGLLTPKTVAKTLEVAAGTVAAVATLVFAIAGGPARSDDRLPRILSEAELDQVYAGFMVTRSNGFAQISDPSNPLFNAHEILSIGSNFFREDAADPSDSKYWQYFPTGGQIGKLTIPRDTLVRIYPVANTSVNPNPNNPGVFTYLPDNNPLGGFFNPQPNTIYYMEQSTTHYTIFDTNLERITYRQ
jgi:hypothetical protein